MLLEGVAREATTLAGEIALPKAFKFRKTAPSGSQGGS